MVSVYALLSEAPGANQIASMHLTHLSKLLETSSRGHYGKEKAIEIREAAKRSIGCSVPAKSLELQHTIRLISELDREIDEVEEAIRQIVHEMNPPLLTIPGISYPMGAMILAEISDFSRQDSRLCRRFTIHLPIRSTRQCSCAHGKARFTLSAIRLIQRCQIRLHLGPKLCCLPCQKTC